MRLGSLAVSISCALCASASSAQDAAEIERIASTMVRLCVAGGHTQAVTGGATGGADLSLRSLDVKGNLQGEFKINKSTAEGLVGGIENAMSQIAADQADKVRACLQPVRERLLDVMLPRKPPGAEPPGDRPGHAAFSIAGHWRDSSGTVVFQLSQEGEKFNFSSLGRSCTGGYARTCGEGSIAGDRRLFAKYRSSLPSEGECSGVVDQNGMQMIYECIDTVCGTYTISAFKQ